MQWVEVPDGRAGEVVRVQHREEAHDDAGYRQRMEDGVQKLNVDSAGAARESVQEHRCIASTSSLI